MKTKPPGVEYAPIVCGACVHEGRAQRVWRDPRCLMYVCPIHGAVLTLQYLESLWELFYG